MVMTISSVDKVVMLGCSDDHLQRWSGSIFADAVPQVWLAQATRQGGRQMMPLPQVLRNSEALATKNIA